VLGAVRGLGGGDVVGVMHGHKEIRDESGLRALLLRAVPPRPPSYSVDTPRPSPRTNRTRRVPHPVLIGHAASLTPEQVERDPECNLAFVRAPSLAALAKALQVRAASPSLPLRMARSNGPFANKGSFAASPPPRPAR
jgi:hypothetical protein